MSPLHWVRSKARAAHFVAALSGVSIVVCELGASGCDTSYRDCVEADNPASRRICEAFLPSTGTGGTGGGTPIGCVPSMSDRSEERR